MSYRAIQKPVCNNSVTTELPGAQLPKAKIYTYHIDHALSGEAALLPVPSSLLIPVPVRATSTMTVTDIEISSLANGMASQVNSTRNMCSIYRSL